MTKPIATLTLALTLIAASAGRPAAAVQQPISEAEAIELNDALVPEIRRLNQNFAELSKSLPPRESRAVLDVVARVREACDTVTGLAILATIHQQMLNAADQSRVEYWLPNQLALAKQRLDRAALSIDAELGARTAPAASSQAQKIRLSLQDLRRQLEQYSY